MLLCLAPMDGITDCAFRIVCKKIFDKYNKENKLLLFTEFMSSDGYFHNTLGVGKHFLHTEIEYPLVVQIFGGSIDNLIYTARDLDSKYDFYGIELNIGCPSPKIMACGGGSFLMRDKKKTLEIIKALRKNIKSKFSIKTRIGMDQKDRDAQFDFLIAASEYVDFIGLHGRTMKQGHSGEVDREFMYNLKSKLNLNTKLIGNGGIKTYNEAHIKLGNLDGVMIGQGSFGNPWIFTDHTPDKKEIFETIILHLDLLLACEIYYKNIKFLDAKIQMPSYEDLMNIVGNYESYKQDFKMGLKTPLEFRKHLFWYIRGIPNSKGFKENIIKIKDYIALKDEISNFFQKVI